MSLFDVSISVTVGLMCLAAALALRTIGHKAAPRLTVLLILAAAVAIVGTPIGQMLRDAIGWADQSVASLIGHYTGAAAIGLLGFCLALVVGFDLYHRSVSNLTLGAAAALPTAAATIPGAAGQVVMAVVQAVAGVFGALGSAAF